MQTEIVLNKTQFSVGWDWNVVTACDISKDAIVHLKKWQKEKRVKNGTRTI